MEAALEDAFAGKTSEQMEELKKLILAKINLLITIKRNIEEEED